MSHLYVLRHTKIKNPHGLCYGRTDMPLATTYPSEKRSIFDRLPKIDLTFSSPSNRCWQLANDLNQGICSKDERLLELDFGDWEGRPWSEISPEETKTWIDDIVSTPCPNGESFDNLCERIDQFICSLQKRNEDILIVTHGGPIKAFYHHLNGLTKLEAINLDIPYGTLSSFKP